MIRTLQCETWGCKETATEIVWFLIAFHLCPKCAKKMREDNEKRYIERIREDSGWKRENQNQSYR